jgi:hypothetical protein
VEPDLPASFTQASKRTCALVSSVMDLRACPRCANELRHRDALSDLHGRISVPKVVRRVERQPCRLTASAQRDAEHLPRGSGEHPPLRRPIVRRARGALRSLPREVGVNALPPVSS